MFHEGNQPSHLFAVFIALGLILVLALPKAAYGASAIEEFVLPSASSRPTDIVAGPNGNLWFTELDGNKIGQITSKGLITEFALPTADSGPVSLTAGPDGNLWFTELMGNRIGRITTGGKITEFSIPTEGSSLSSIVTGPDGNVWFIESEANRIGRITTSGKITEFPVPREKSEPGDIQVGPDGNLWFTEFEGNQIGQITTSGKITEFPILTDSTGPGSIATGLDGNLWFTEFDGNKIGRITPTGSITEFSVLTGDSQPNIITKGPDGNLWFTEFKSNQIGQITTSGAVTEFPILSDESEPDGIVAGPDGNLWFTESAVNKIGRFSLNGISGPTVTPNPSSSADTKINSPCIGVQSNEKIQPHGKKQWTAPAQVIDVSHTYCAILTTNNGRMVAELFPKIAPKNVNNFVFLAQNGFYDNITWHRVIADFVAQSGDPTGTGAGGPGYSNIPLEVNGDLKYDREGRLGVARTSDPNSAGSQFFITLAPTPFLNGGYTIIGQVVEGLTVLHQIKIRSADTNPNLPKGDPLLSVRIVDLGPSSGAPSAHVTPGS